MEQHLRIRSLVRISVPYTPAPQMTALRDQATAEELASAAELGLLAEEPDPNEACLVLNVWFHGGAYIGGSAAAPLYDFCSLARRGDIVAVGVNHRLGAFGYLNLAQLGDDSYADSGNVGNLDLICALRWVGDNIAGFGGDPDNVTIVGQSGGAHKVSMLLAMPAADGLFHRAMLISPPDAGKAHTTAETTLVAEELLAQLGLRTVDVDGLRKLSLDRLDAAQAALLQRAGPNVFRQMLLFWPVLDRRSVPRQPIEALRAGAARVPLLIGTTSDEIANLAPLNPAASDGRNDMVRAWLDDQIGPAGDAVFAAYRALRSGDAPGDVLEAVLSDHLFRLPTIRFAEAAATGNAAPVFMYCFTRPDPRLPRRAKAPHSWDLPFFFDNLDRAPAADVPGGRDLAVRASETLIAFARSGDPGHTGLPPWPPYSFERRETMLLGDACAIANDPYGAERRVWDDVESVGLIAESGTTRGAPEGTRA